MSRRRFWTLLGLIALAGFVLRVWNIDFDQRQHLNPDERHWALTSAALDREPQPASYPTVLGPVLDWLDADRSPANPYRVTESFNYGPAPLAWSRSIAGWLQHGASEAHQPANAVGHALDAVGLPLLDASGSPRFDDAYQVDLIGRLLGAVFDTLTLVLIGLIGRRVAGALAGLVAAGLYAVCVLAIQLSHFLGAEPMLGAACALTLLAAISLDRSADIRAGVRTGAVLGLAVGSAMAAKLTGLGLVAVPVVGCVALVVCHRRRSDAARLAALCVSAFVAFRLLNPGAFSGLSVMPADTFVSDLRASRALASSTLPPSFQWARRLPVLQPIAWLFTFTIGPAAWCAAIGGAFVVATRRWGRVSDAGRWTTAMLFGGVLVPFLYIEVSSLPTGRYYVPMLPAFFVLAGIGVAYTVHQGRERSGRPLAVAIGAAGGCVLVAVLWGAAFVHGVYGHTNTRIEATEWIVDNVPDGSVLTSQAWDDGLPLGLPGVDPERYDHEQLNMVGPDDEEKVARIVDQLQRVDYVVESSPRIWRTVERMPARFPSTINFFEGLDDGSLGFRRVATFRSPPRLGPFVLDDSWADEAFSVYDHPEVRVWHKVRDVDVDTMTETLDPVAASTALPVEAARGWANGLMLDEHEIGLNRAGPTYDEAFDTGRSPWVHVVAWFVLLELVGLAAFVLIRPLLRDLPDAGFGTSKAVALVMLTSAMFVWSGWLARPAGRAISVVLVVGLIVVAAYVATRTRRDLAVLWHARRSVLIAAEALTSSLFTLAILLRAANPDLWHPDRGGEKPFELSLLTAVLRSRAFPVYDPWFADGVLNYHYGGWYLLSVPARVLRTSPSLVMNIGIAVVASCAGGALFSLGAAAIDGPPRRRRLAPRSNAVVASAGVAAALGTLMLSSLAVVRPLRQALSGADAPADWWGLSRVVPDSVVITEFPAWSFLFGDLHPHLMGIGVLSATAVMCVALHAALAAGSGRRSLAMAGLTGVLLGFVRLTNTWDLPLAIGSVALALGAAAVSGARWRRVASAAAVAAAVFTVFWAPSTWRGEVYDGGVDPAQLFTPMSSWFRQFGFFVVVTMVMIGATVAVASATSPSVRGAVKQLHVTLLGLLLLAVGIAAIDTDRTVTMSCAVLAGGAAWVAWRRAATIDSIAGAVGPLLLAVGWLVQAGVETFTIRNDGGRMNTVFKFWYQSWIALAVGSAVVLVEFVADHRAPAAAWQRRFAVVSMAAAVFVTASFWWIATPARLDDRISDGGLHLDGEAYLRSDLVVGGDDSFRPGSDAPLVDWLRREVAGIQVIAEVPGEDYRWTSRFSSLTGLPTPIGWPYHESQQRRIYGAAIERRRADMSSLFTTTDTAEIASILERYDIAYVVFGTRERLASSPRSASVLRRHPCLHESFTITGDDGELWIAEVDPHCVTRVRRSAR